MHNTQCTASLPPPKTNERTKPQRASLLPVETKLEEKEEDPLSHFISAPKLARIFFNKKPTTIENDNAREVGFRGDERGAVDAAAIAAQADLLRAEPVEPRRGEDVVRLEPGWVSGAPLLPLLAHPPLARVLHVALLRLAQEPPQPLRLAEAAARRGSRRIRRRRRRK